LEKLKNEIYQLADKQIKIVKNLPGIEKIWVEGENKEIDSLRVSEVEESKAFMRMSRLVRTTKRRLDLLDLIILLSLRSEKKLVKQKAAW